MERREVTRVLSDAARIRVHNDPTAWHALLLLHGLQPGARVPRGHSLLRCTSHARAALAAAVALALMTGALRTS